MKPDRSRILRPLRAATGALFAVGALASCGGGSGAEAGGGGGGPVVPACLSTQGGGSGFALGSCQSAAKSVLQPVSAGVVVSPGVPVYPSEDGYTLTLVFPPELQEQQSLDGDTGFTRDEQPGQDDRNVVGVLRGQAYESDADQSSATLTPPYVALTDFHRAWDSSANPASDPPLLELMHARFGTWEKFANADFNDGFLGVWSAPRGSSNNSIWPTGAFRSYAGRVVGVVAPDGSTGASLPRPYELSAQIAIDVDGAGRIASGKVHTMQISYLQGDPPVLVTEDLPIAEIVVSQAAGDTPGTATGTLSTAAGASGGSVAGDYEARFFAAPGPPGAELAGQMRFTTDTGLVGVASFGAALLP